MGLSTLVYCSTGSTLYLFRLKMIGVSLLVISRILLNEIRVKIRVSSVPESIRRRLTKYEPKFFCVLLASELNDMDIYNLAGLEVQDFLDIRIVATIQTIRRSDKSDTGQIGHCSGKRQSGHKRQRGHIGHKRHTRQIGHFATSA